MSENSEETKQHFVSRHNLPNKITVARIVMIFIFLLICNIEPLEDRKLWRSVGLIFAIIAGLTDILDGWLARHYKVVSDFGRLMDPLADKIFIAATFIIMVDKDLLAGWVAVVVLSREFLVTGLRLLAVNKGKVISADISGKLKTSMQMGFLILGGSMWAGWVERADIEIFWQICVYAIVAITVYSGVSYFVKHRHLYLSST